jgi:hypothetical protein
MSDLWIAPFFLDTYKTRISKLSIDYAWSGCISKPKPSNLPQEWTKYSETHEIFYTTRKILLLRQTQSVDAFALGVKSLPTNSDIPENTLKQIKEDWCNCPEGFQNELNWNAYDSEICPKHIFWPYGNSAQWDRALVVIKQLVNS